MSHLNLYINNVFSTIIQTLSFVSLEQRKDKQHILKDQPLRRSFYSTFVSVIDSEIQDEIEFLAFSELYLCIC
jgi:hypothetical protein